MYHRIAHDRSERRYTVLAGNFEQQLVFLRDHDYQVITLDAVVDALDGRTSLPEKSIVLTFDDGFRDTVEYACPILRRFGYSATFFLISGLMGRSNEWMQREGHKSSPLIDWSDARNLFAEGFVVGSHSVSHPSLPAVDLPAARREIEGSKQTLEQQLSVPIKYFAYPYGRFNHSIQEVVREVGYVAACSTQAGFNGPTAERFALRRLDVFGTHSLTAFRRNLIFGENEMNAVKLLAYYARRATSRIATNLR